MSDCFRSRAALAAFGLAMLCGGAAWGQTEGAGGAKRSCVVAKQGNLSPADEALAQGKFDEAEKLYAAMPVSGAVTAGRVRALLGERKLDDALALAAKEQGAQPNDALLLDVLGEVRYRRGEVGEAALAYNRSLALDPCLARTHYDIGRYLNLNGMNASGQAQLEIAHKLAPEDPTIKRVWEGTQRVPMTAAQQILGLRMRLQSGTLTEEEKSATENGINALMAREKGDCELAAPVTAAKIPMWASNSSNSSARPPTNSGMDVLVNGKRRRFLVDTGASGLLISSAAAKSLGLTPEAELKSFGIGDEGSKGTYLAHVDSLKMGGLEFHNCMVRVLESKTLQWTDGLLGPDMFRGFVVTLDFPANEMRLSPLPKRPDEAEKAVTLGTAGEDDAGGGAAGLTIAQSRKDRYVAPEMQDWQKIFRSGHDLIVPTVIGKAPSKLFILDTGAGQNLISPDAAREVTKVSADSMNKVRGISGEVKNVYGTNSITIQFARVRQTLPVGMTAIDTSSFSRGTGVEISGFIGYPTLRELVMQIDYRDNLVHVTYTPHNE